MARVAFVTYSEQPNLHPDDQATLPALAKLGVHPEPVAWDAPVDWKQFDLIVIRSTWDYFRRWPEFEAWLNRLAALGVNVHNPPATLRWNARKTYLRELADQGVPVVETHWVTQGATDSLERILEMHGWDEAVLKPSISGGAYQTYRLKREDAAKFQPRFDEIAARCEVMVQPFVPEVLTEGERSLVFFNRFLSHALHKRPQPGEFRVQLEHGGSVVEFTPDPKMREIAERALSLIPGPLLYARVDLVKVRDQVLLNELEVLEPMLYFRYGNGSAERFAEAVKSKLG